MDVHWNQLPDVNLKIRVGSENFRFFGLLEFANASKRPTELLTNLISDVRFGVPSFSCKSFSFGKICCSHDISHEEASLCCIVDNM